VDRIEREHERITVTRRGRDAVVSLSADDLAALEDTLELLSDPSAMREIAKARSEVTRGKVVGADELRRKYLRR